MTEFKVGDGATLYLYSDRHACTVVEATAKRVTVQRDKATLVNRDELTFSPGGFAGHVSGKQKYEYERDNEGYRREFSLRKSGRWVAKGEPDKRGSTTLGFGRHEYYDYNF